VSKIDLNRVWDDARAMGAANKDLLAAIAGMFVLLPSVVGNLLIKQPLAVRQQSAAATKDLPAGEMYGQLMSFYTDNWPVVLGLSIALAFGLLTMLVLLLRHERLTVGESLKAAVILLPGYIVANLIEGFAFAIGFLLFIIPCIYVMGRFSILAAVASAEQRVNPVEQHQRSWALTSRNGWRIGVMLVILWLTAQVVNVVATTLVGLIGELVLPKDLADLVVSIVGGLVSAGFTAFVALLTAAIYRAATEPAPSPWLPGSER
jgi:hypothetical protein